MQFTVPFVLASRSPRRRLLLRRLGIAFSVIPADIDESAVQTRGIAPTELVRTLSIRKAAKVSRRRPDALVLGADTIVVHKGRVLGKPTDEQEARAMLRQLSDSSHMVYTGVALLHAASNRAAETVSGTEVSFGQLSDEEIHRYVATGSPMDKAGGYGIQDDLGTIFIEAISGDYYTVVGLPLRGLYELLKKEFSDLFRL